MASRASAGLMCTVEGLKLVPGDLRGFYGVPWGLRVVPGGLKDTLVTFLKAFQQEPSGFRSFACGFRGVSGVLRETWRSQGCFSVSAGVSRWFQVISLK